MRAARPSPTSCGSSLVATVSARDAARQALAAVRQNARPFVLIQACAFLAVFAYYQVPAVGQISEAAADLKARGGLPLTAVATVFAGLVLPTVAERLTRSGRPLSPREIAFRVAFYALIGIVIDLAYRGQALVFGNGTTWDVVLKKALVDQFILTPFLTIPYSFLAFLWNDHRFSFRATADDLRANGILPRYVPLLVTCWAFWMPTLLAVFAMPTRLQFVLFLLAQAAWSLLLVTMTQRRAPTTPAPLGT